MWCNTHIIMGDWIFHRGGKLSDDVIRTGINVLMCNTVDRKAGEFVWVYNTGN